MARTCIIFETDFKKWGLHALTYRVNKSAMSFDDYYVPASEEHKKRERRKARELRQSQWWKQKIGQGICHYCENRFPKEELTMDHLVPVSRGGKSTKGNVVVSCKGCNSHKKHLTPAEMLLAEMNQKK